MKKILLLTILTISVSPLFAQSFNFGIRGGLNESTLDYDQSYPGSSHSRLAGFNAGAFVDVGFGNISIEPGLFYTTKGQKSSYVNSSTNAEFTGSGTGKVTYNYLELPVNVLYNISTPIGKIFIGGGPYIAYGLSGSMKINFTSTPQGTTTPVTTNTNYKITFGGTDNGLKREDYGLGAIGGLRLKNRITLNLGYEHSVFNIFKNDEGSDKHDVISFSIGYAFL